MTNPSLDLFLLTISLSQIKKPERVIQMFIEGMNCLFPGGNCRWADHIEPGPEHHIEVCTRNETFGFILHSGCLQSNETEGILAHNASQMLAVILEKLRQEQLLREQKEALESLAAERARLAAELEARVAERTGDLEKANRALLESRMLLQDIEHITKVGGWEYNVETRRMTWTEEVYRIHGLSPQDHDPNDITSNIAFYTSEDQAVVAAAFRSAVEQGIPYDLELGLTRKNGERLWIRTMGQAERRDGRIVRVYGNLMDISARKRAEEALRESEETFRRLFEESVDPILLMEDNRFVACNQAVIRFLGLPDKAAFLGLTPADISPEKQPDGRPSQQAARQFIERAHKEGYCRFDWMCQRIDGTLLLLEVTLVPILLKGQSLLHITWRDITEQRRALDERERLSAQLSHAQKMESIGRLAGGVAHDFNNMLQVILNHTEMALEQMEPHHAACAGLEEIRKAASRSADLTRQLLAFARKQTIAPKIINLNETLAGMLKMLPRLIGESIALSANLAQDLWPVRMDPSQADQILANLCVNARDAIGGIGAITIETENKNIGERFCADHLGVLPGQYVRLAVTDTGRGMDEETLAHIFEPFFTTKKTGEGTGLGLATVYGVVKQNNGFINVYSEPGHGTTFTIYFPRHAGSSESPKPDPEEKPAPGGHETILLVEDEPSILLAIAKILEHQGYRVLTAATPGEAMALAREHRDEIHLLITDVVMPEMNGRDLAKNLLAIHPLLKRLFMSGYTADVIAHHGVLDEGIHFIQKPFSSKDLAAKVREALGI